MNKPNTPKSKPPKASKQNNNTIKVTKHIAQWDPARDLLDVSNIQGSKSQAEKLFVVLSNGHHVHRLNADSYGFVKNLSLHSVVSTLEKMYDLPVERKYVKLPCGSTVCEFSFSPEIIEAITDPEKRKTLAGEFRIFRESRFLERVFKGFRKSLFIILIFPQLLTRNPVFRDELIQIKEQITLVLERGEK